MEIKKEVQILYKTLKKAQDRLEEIRSVCPHDKTIEGDYSYRPGAVHPATMCPDCGEVIKFHWRVSETEGKRIANIMAESTGKSLKSN